MAIDLSDFHIVKGDDIELVEKLNAALDATEIGVNEGIADASEQVALATTQAGLAALSEAAALSYLTQTQEVRDQAIAIVYGGEYSITAGAGKVAIADTDKRLGTDWMHVGSAPNQIPLNQFLGGMAYQSPEAIIIQPQASAVPACIGNMVFQLTSDTSLTIKVKGSDGTVRSVDLTLA